MRLWLVSVVTPGMVLRMQPLLKRCRLRLVRVVTCVVDRFPEIVSSCMGGLLGGWVVLTWLWTVLRVSTVALGPV